MNCGKYLFLTLLSALAITGCYEPEGYNESDGSGGNAGTGESGGGGMGGRTAEEYFRQFTYRTQGAAHTYLKSPWTETRSGQLLIRAHLFLHPDGRFDMKYEEATGHATGSGAQFRDAIESRPFSGTWKIENSVLSLGDIGIGTDFKVNGRPAIRLEIKQEMHSHARRRAKGTYLVFEKGMFTEGLDALGKNIYVSDAMSWLHDYSYVATSGDKTHRWTFFADPAVFYREEHSKKCAWRIASSDVVVHADLDEDHVTYSVSSRDKSIEPIGNSNDLLCSTWIAAQRAAIGGGRNVETRFQHKFADEIGDEWLEQGSLKLRRQSF